MQEQPVAPKERKNAILRSLRASLLARGDATKAELSDRIGVSFPTISKFVDQLERAGELLLIGIDESSGGRRAKRYGYNSDYVLGLAIFLERNETNYAVFNAFGEVKEEGSGPGVLLEELSALTRLIEERLAACPTIAALAIGVPGAVNQGRILFIPGYPAFHQLDLKRYLEERLAVPVVVENDMNAAVLGYYSKRKTEDRPSLVYLYFGHNGPGSGIMINGDVVRGSTFFSGEISLVPLYDNRNFHQALRFRREPGEVTLSEEGVDAISRLIAALTAIINPHTVIFCRDEASDAVLREIAARSAAYVPAEQLPLLTTSDWKQDYLNGLQYLGQQLILSAAPGSLQDAEQET